MNPAPLKEDEPSVVGLAVRPKLAIALFGLLGVSAALALWVQRNPGMAPLWAERGAPWVFLVFVVGFAAYRFSLVAAHRYSAFRAFFQIFIAAIFFMLLLPGSPFVVRPEPPVTSLTPLLVSPDPRVRSVAAEVAGFRKDPTAAPALIGLLDDPDLTVRAQARAALIRLNEGVDLGDTAPAWKERFP